MTFRGGFHRLREAGTLGEWVLGGISLTAVLAVAGLLLYQGFTRAPEGPVVRVRVDGVRAGADSVWVVDFTAENTGAAPARNVTIQGRLGRGPGPLEQAEVTIDLIPEGSARQGGLQFRTDPRSGPLDLRATGWIRP